MKSISTLVAAFFGICGLLTCSVSLAQKAIGDMALYHVIEVDVNGRIEYELRKTVDHFDASNNEPIYRIEKMIAGKAPVVIYKPGSSSDMTRLEGAEFVANCSKYYYPTKVTYKGKEEPACNVRKPDHYSMTGFVIDYGAVPFGYYSFYEYNLPYSTRTTLIDSDTKN